VVDAEGRTMPSVVAKPISDVTLEAGEVVRESDENKLLMLIYRNPGASFTTLATKAGYVDGAGNPVKYRVQRIIERLFDDRLIEKHRAGKYQLTKKGKREIGVDKEEAADD
jgi:predicted transcriptional regulator